MKKLLSLFLILTVIVGTLTIPVFAEKTANLVPDKNSTFETDSTDWTALSGGTVSIATNPDGKGKVLKYSDIPDKSFASPWLDVRSYIQGSVSKPAIVYGSFDAYAQGEDVTCMLRLRTKTANGHSMCKEQNANYCTIATGVNVPKNQWTTVYFQFDVTQEDLKSAENWSIAFDGIYNSKNNTKPEAFYIDNFTITAEELDASALAPRPEPDDIEGNVILAQTSANLIDAKNSVFGAGSPGWSILKGGVLAVTDNPDGEGQVLEYTEIPEYSYASPWFDVRPYILKEVKEETTIYGSIAVYCPDTNLSLMVRMRTNTPAGFSLCEVDDKNYCTLTSSAVAAGEWTTINFSFDIIDTDLTSTEPWHICFDGIYKDSVPEAFYIDNFYIGLRSPDEFVENQPIPEKSPIERNEKTLVGTIRWDAFTKSEAGTMGISSQVAKVLSPKKYHCQAPFFANIEADDTVSFPEYTVKTWEQEAAYAVKGGLGYFAYLWYETTSDMSQPRKMHLKSSKKDTIKMAGILESIASEQSMAELYNAMKDSCYLTVSGMPVLFLYGLDDWKAEDVLKLRQGAANAGITKALYIVGMSMTTDLNKFTSNAKKGIDAISWYSVGANEKGESFESLAKRCEQAMNVISGYCLANNIDLIPAFTAGRDTRARIETGVSWVDGDPNAVNDNDKPYKNRYALPPTMAELEKHMQNVISYANTNKLNCKTNIVCSYGWNEHEEGGWLCPTLLCDENGDLILDSKGNKQANTERLDTLLKVLKNLNLAPEVVPEKTPVPKATPTATPDISNEDNSFKLWWIIPAIVVVLGGAVATIIIIKKKKATNTDNAE